MTLVTISIPTIAVPLPLPFLLLLLLLFLLLFLLHLQSAVVVTLFTQVLVQILRVQFILLHTLYLPEAQVTVACPHRLVSYEILLPLTHPKPQHQEMYDV
jgi:hypothetical protein